MSGTFSSDGGHLQLESSPVEIIIPPNAVLEKIPTQFSIKECSQNFNLPIKGEKLSPVFELEPHATYFNQPVKVVFNLDNKTENLCLYKQGNEEDDKILNKWSIHFPEEREKNKFEFELKSFSFGFLGKMNAGIDVNSKGISNDKFNEKFKNYQFIYPGLNYRVKCEDFMCVGNTEVVISKRGFGTFQPNNEVDLGQLKCPICNKILTKMTSIEAVILFQSRGLIQYKLNKKGETLQTVPFDMIGNNLTIFGDNKEAKSYTTLKVTVEKNLNFDEKLRAGVTNAMIRNKIYSRTIVLMDATGSMGGLLEEAKATVTTMFQQAVEILKEHNIAADCFEIQFVCYRDYDCGLEKILEASSWEKSPENLKKFMEKINPQGGDDTEEAIEIGFWHVNQENKKFQEKNEKISQVILIADAGAKERNVIKEYRDRYGGNAMWKAKFGDETYYLDELNKMKNNGILVYPFYLNLCAQRNFEEIATISGTSDQCQLLNINSAEGAKTLSRIVTTKILSEVGASVGMGNTLSNAYITKFK